jgi:hypothetical protein
LGKKAEKEKRRCGGKGRKDLIENLSYRCLKKEKGAKPKQKGCEWS